MSRTKYREERTLVRGLHRLPGEDRAVFKAKVLRLRRHFEQFNLDAAELCQWLMGIRPDGKRLCAQAQPLWEYLVGSASFEEEPDEDRRDWTRLRAFELATALDGESSPNPYPLPETVIESASAVATLPLTQSARALLSRLADLSRPHRMILLKSAAEWVHSRYVRGYENWRRQHELWLDEKAQWERNNPELTPEVCDDFNRVFNAIGVKIRSPRVCSWERLRHTRNDCEYAGERITVGNKRMAHSPLCVKYNKLRRELKSLKKNPKYFVENARKYLTFRRAGLSEDDAMSQLLTEVPRAKGWFPDAWKRYLELLEIKEETLLGDYGGALPHCVEFVEKTDCAWNPHTNECVQYRGLISGFPQDRLALEEKYREWRRRGFWRAPRKPVFQYPSSRTLPMPKIFGRGFHQIRFGDSIVHLRLDEMPEGQFLDFGFKPWPEDYDIRPEETEISSVQVTFVGTRARIGFRFRVKHRASRFRMTQDDIDTLRSRDFPRASLDQKFLNAARDQLLGAFDGDARKEMRILSVDLGTSEAAVGLLEGERFIEARRLNVVKLDRVLDSWPQSQLSATDAPRTGKGLSVDHVEAHLRQRGEATAEIANVRQARGDDPELRAHDMRRFTHHIQWMIRDWVRLNASQIIAVAEEKCADLILFESLRGFMPPGYDQPDIDKKRRLAFFAYGRIRRKVAEKAVERGMLVLTVPYKHSSQICSRCGRRQENVGLWRKNKGRHVFKCEDRKCGFNANSDENAARVLARVFWGDITLPETD